MSSLPFITIGALISHSWFDCENINFTEFSIGDLALKIQLDSRQSESYW